MRPDQGPEHGGLEFAEPGKQAAQITSDSTVMDQSQVQGDTEGGGLAGDGRAIFALGLVLIAILLQRPFTIGGSLRARPAGILTGWLRGLR